MTWQSICPETFEVQPKFKKQVKGDDFLDPDFRNKVNSWQVFKYTLSAMILIIYVFFLE